MLGRKHVPGRRRGQHHRARIVQRYADCLAAVRTDLPGQPPLAGRPQCQWRRRDILPPAPAGGEDPAHYQVGDVGVFGKVELRAPRPAAQQFEDAAIGRGQVIRRRVLQLLGG